MAITETSNTDLTYTVILWKASATLRSLMLCSQKLSAGASNNDTSKSR